MASSFIKIQKYSVEYPFPLEDLPYKKNTKIMTFLSVKDTDLYLSSAVKSQN